MIPEKIRQRQRAELAAIHRLEAAGYTVEGWNHTTSLCTVARLDGLNTNHDKSDFWSFPTWQAAASALLGWPPVDTLPGLHRTKQPMPSPAGA